MAKKTNKTSHVLNLLTNGAPEGEEAKESQGPAGKEAGAAETHAAAPENKVIVVNETSENEKLSNEIKNRLEAQLEAEEAEAKLSRPASQDKGEQAPAGVSQTASAEAAPAPAASTSAAPEPAASAPAASTPSASAPVSSTSAAPAPEARTEEKAAPAPAPEAHSRKRAYNMLNVMERLLADMEGEMENEMRQNGVCMCDRCRADVQALVLTNMPAKYVIVDSSNASPILGYHKNRYKIAMLTEILKACSKVKESPRH